MNLKRPRTWLIILGSLVALLVFCELAVRYLLVTIPDRQETAYAANPDCVYTLRPSPAGQFPETDDRHVNSLGFRDVNHAMEKPDDVLRVIGLGDSFVYGDVPIAHNFLRVLQDEVEDAEVVIAGLPGWDVRNATGFMQGPGHDLHPDLAILSFSVGSDVTGIPIPGRVYQGNLHFVGSHFPVLNVLRKSRLFLLMEQVHLARVANTMRRLRMRRLYGDQAVAQTVPVHNAEAASRARYPGAPVFPGMWGEPSSGEAYSGCSAGFIDLQIKNLDIFLKETPPDLEHLWQQAEKQLLDFDAACRIAECSWLLLIAASEIQVDPQVRAAVLARAPYPAEAYDFDQPTRRLLDFAARHNIQAASPLETLRQAHNAGTRQYIPNNAHWNVPGNRTVAAFLADQIKTGNR
jgi:hypothetical protein